MHSVDDLHRLFRRGILADSPDFVQLKQPDGRYQLKLKLKAPALIPAPPPPPPLTSVLVWPTNCNGIISLVEVTAIYNTMGLDRVDTAGTWTGDLNDYGLVIWLMAESNPVWLGQLTTWKGRIHIGAEWSGFPTTIAYVNSLTSYHEMTVNPDLVGGGLCYSGHEAATTHPLAAGMSELICAASSTVSGGSTVFNSTGDIMQQNKPANIDWVVVGDSNHLSDECHGVAAMNQQFLVNLLLPVV